MCGGATTVGRSSMAPHQLPYADDDIDRPIGIAHRPIRINRDRNPQPSVSSHPRGRPLSARSDRIAGGADGYRTAYP